MSPEPLLEYNWNVIDTQWLPKDVSEDIQRYEAQRFENVVRSVQDVARQLQPTPTARPEFVQDKAPWTSIIDTFMQSKRYYDPHSVAQLYHAVVHVAFALVNLPEQQGPWLTSASGILMAYGDDFALLDVRVEWKEYWDMLERLRVQAMENSHDNTTARNAFQMMHPLCRLARHLYKPEAARAIWDLLLPRLSQTVCPASLSALTMLLTFFPQRAVQQDRSLPWNEWVQTGLRIWGACGPHNSFREKLWLAWFARLAKWDTFGVIEWERVLKPLCARGIWQFRVPVGASRIHSFKPVYPHEPLIADIAAMTTNEQSHPCDQVAKIIVYSLRPDLSLESSAPDGLTPLAALQTFAKALEHYFNASNSGSWSRDLAEFLESLCYQLLSRRLMLEAAPTWRGSDAVRLPADNLHPVAAVLQGLAGQAIFHKSDDLQAAAADTIANMAILSPRTALPFAWKSFAEALAATDAVHQLQHSIRLLAECVRPMLLYGLPPASEQDVAANGDLGGSLHQNACKALGQAMTMLLPALDANDEDKLAASIGFYVAVFSSCVTVAGIDTPDDDVRGSAVMRLEMYLQEFADDFLERVFNVFDTLHTAADTMTDVDDSKTSVPLGSWLGSDTKWMALLSEYFAKVPWSVAEASARKVAKHVMTITQPEKAEDLTMMVYYASFNVPHVAEEMLSQMISAVRSEWAAQPSGFNMTQVFVSSMIARLSLLCATVQGLARAHRLTAHADALYDLVVETALSSSPAILDSAVRIYEAVLIALSANWVEKVPSVGISGSYNGAVAAWVSTSGKHSPPLKWNTITDADIKLARGLAERAVTFAGGEIEAMIADGTIRDSGHAARARLRRAQSLLHYTQGALREAGLALDLTDEASQRAAEAETSDSVAICGMRTLEGWDGCTAVQDGLRYNLKIVEHTDPANTTSIVTACNYVTNIYDLGADVCAWMDDLSYSGYDRSVTEPCTADILLGNKPGTRGIAHRVAPWNVSFKLKNVFTLRRSLHFRNWWATTDKVQLTVQDMHPLLMQAVAKMQQLSMTRYGEVSRAAAEALAVAPAARMPDLVLRLAPGFTAGMALLQERPEYGLPLGPTLEADVPAALPSSTQEVEQKLQAQATALMGVLSRSNLASNGSGSGNGSGASSPMRMDMQPVADTSRLGAVLAAADGASGSDIDEGDENDGRVVEDDAFDVVGSDAGGDSAAQISALLRRTESPGLNAAAPMRKSSRGSGPLPELAASRSGVRASAALAQGIELLKLPSMDASSSDLQAVVAALGKATLPASPATDKAGASSKPGVAAAPAGDAQCNASNKHVVKGALAAVQQVSDMLPRVMLLQPLLMKVVFLIALVATQFETLEVKADINMFIVHITKLFPRLRTARGFMNTTVMADVVAMLVDKLASATLHWRQAVLSHIYFAHFVRVCEDTDLLRRVTLRQLEDSLHSKVLITKDTALSGIANTLLYAVAPSTADGTRSTILDTVRARLAEAQDWAEPLLLAMQASNNLNSLDALESAGHSRDCPEHYLSLVLGNAVISYSMLDGTLFLSGTPDARLLKSDGKSMRVTLSPSNRKFVELLGRVAPHELMPTLCTGLEAWLKTGNEAEKLEDSFKEFIVMEACVGAIASGAAHSPMTDGSPCHWDAWLRSMLEARYNGASVDKGGMWAFVLARSARIAANDVNGTTLERMHASLVPAHQETTLRSVVACVCELSRGWSGTSVADAKHSNAIMYLLENLLQAQSAASHPVLEEVLEQVCEAGVRLVDLARKHAMQSVRTRASKLARMLLVVLRAPVRVVSASVRDESAPSSLASRFVTRLREAFQAAEIAVKQSLESNEHVGDADTAMREDGDADNTAQPATSSARLHEWEAAIGFMIVFIGVVCQSSTQRALLRDMICAVVPWMLHVQAVDHPGLQSLVPAARRLRSSSLDGVDAHDAGAVLEMLMRAATDGLWQVRITSLGLMQGFWFRNIFAISEDAILRLITLSRERLLDDKLEVRELAAQNLSGLLKCCPPHARTSFLGTVLDDAARLFPFKRKRGMDESPKVYAASGLREHHACVLALHALLLSSPYKVEPWMDDVLLAITRAARVPAPVKTSAIEALGDFRRSQEGASSAPLKERLKEHVWECVRDVAFGSSYFV